MSTVEIILIYIFVIGFTIFFIGVGAAIAWMVIEDTSLGRAIDEAIGEWIERWRNERSDS